jgi:endonuclease/exonuclease/phosphatase (EEP) superfamily protein YafD
MAEPQAETSSLRSLVSRSRCFLGDLLAVPLWLGIVGLVVALLFAYLMPIHWQTKDPLLRLSNYVAFHIRVFQFHIGLTLLAATLLGLILRRRRMTLLAGLVGALLLGAEAWRATPIVSQPNVEGPTLRVASLNLYFLNRNVDEVETYLRELDADVVTFCEFTRLHLPLDDRLAELYPHRSIPWTDGWGRGGLGILSKYPIAGQKRLVNSHRVRVDVDGRPVDVVAVHHASPGNVRTTNRNLIELDTLVADLADVDVDIIITGDHNASYWTPQMARLRRLGFSDGYDAAEWGRGATWPSSIRRWWTKPILPMGLGIRIDNQMATDGLVAIRSGVGPHVGSDHRAVWTDFRFAAD